MTDDWRTVNLANWEARVPLHTGPDGYDLAGFDDVVRPGKDGWQVAEELASNAETREIPILFLSARSDRSDESRGYELGGLGYITKPFDTNAMTDHVSDMLERLRRGERNEIPREWRDRIHHD